MGREHLLRFGKLDSILSQTDAGAAMVKVRAASKVESSAMHPEYSYFDELKF